MWPAGGALATEVAAASRSKAGWGSGIGSQYGTAQFWLSMAHLDLLPARVHVVVRAKSVHSLRLPLCRAWERRLLPEWEWQQALCELPRPAAGAVLQAAAAG